MRNHLLQNGSELLSTEFATLIVIGEMFFFSFSNDKGEEGLTRNLTTIKAPLSSHRSVSSLGAH